MRAAALLTVTLVVAAVTEARAAVGVTGPTQLRPVVTPSGDSMRSDGRRWVLWFDADLLRGFDDTRRRTFDVPGGIGCRALEQEPGVGEIVLNRNGIGLIRCEGEHRRFDPRTGRAHPIPGLQPGEEMERIGRRWVEGSDESGQFTVLVDWRTGERRDGYTECYDLDRVDPVPADQEDCFYGKSRQRDGRHRLRVDTRYWKNDRVDLLAGDRRLARLNDRTCEAYACSAQLASGWVTLARAPGRTTTQVLAYDTSRRRAFRWRVRGLVSRRETSYERVLVAHTRRTLFVSVPHTIASGPATAGSPFVSRTRLWRGRLP